MRRTLATVAGLTAASLIFTAWGGAAPTGAGEPVTITVSGWAIDTTPEFQVLADGFAAANPGYEVEIIEYDAAEYNTLLTADLAASAGPDIITQKEVKFTPVLVDGGQLLDVSDVETPEGLGGTDSYEVDGVTYAVPYRMDSWVLFYNMDLYDAAGVDYPDGTWTWDDYVAALEELQAGLPDGTFPAYQHSWQSTVQGLANAQSDANILAGDFDHLAEPYQRVLDLQDNGLQLDFNTATANQVTYQGEFGTQQAANMIMGTWYVATLIAQQASGDADAFNWGFAPAPQASSETAGTDNTPVTFGDPTGFGINAAIDEDKVEAAKAFLAYAASEEAAASLAEIGITPALTNDAVVEAYFAVEGAPTDDLSKFAWATHDTHPENPTSNETAAVQAILADLHTAVMSGSTSIDDAIAEAEDRFANEVG